VERKFPLPAFPQVHIKGLLPGFWSTRNFLTFANTTAIAYRKNLEAPGNFSPICNSSCVCKRQKITSNGVEMFEKVVEVVRASRGGAGGDGEVVLIGDTGYNGFSGEFRALESAYISKLQQCRRNYRPPLRRCIQYNLQHK